jgi:hypothetical protein
MPAQECLKLKTAPAILWDIVQMMQNRSAQVKTFRSPEVAQSLLRIAQSTMAEDLANSPLGLHAA